MTEEQNVDFKYGYLIGTMNNIRYYCKTMAPEMAVKNILAAIEFAESVGMMEK